MSQLNLFKPDPKQAKFEKYDSENPAIWEEFKKLTFDLIRVGTKHFSADAILHVIRFNRRIAGNDGYKCNNNYSSYYSRKFTGNFPEHKDFFEQRKLKDE